MCANESSLPTQSLIPVYVQSKIEITFKQPAKLTAVTWSQCKDGYALPGGGDGRDDGAAPAKVLRKDGDGG